MTNLDVETFRKGEAVFRQGEDAHCIYQIQWGSVGIYVDYGTKKERQVARLHGDQYFGEMGVIEGGPRTATAIALEANTRIQVITVEKFRDCMKDRPGKVMSFMQHMSRRIRMLTADYLDACRTVSQAAQAKDDDAGMSAELQEKLHRLAENYRRSV